MDQRQRQELVGLRLRVAVVVGTAPSRVRPRRQCRAVPLVGLVKPMPLCAMS